MQKIRKDFPFLKTKDPLIYLDNAATSQKPQEVIDSISYYYAYQNAPVHRGIYSRAEDLTVLYEQSREVVAKFIGAQSDEVVFTRGATESINFVASTWAQDNLKDGDEIILTQLEHHSNILPWQHLAKTKKIIIKYVPITKDGNLDYEAYLKLLSDKTKLVSFTHSSNAIGTQIDAKFIIDNAKLFGAVTLVDACQSVAHMPLDVHSLNCDFLVFSGHKLLGPTGIGVLYIFRKIQKQVEPYQFGGGMVFQVQCYDASWLKAPNCYEAGTPPIAQAIGLAAAINYITKNINWPELQAHEAQLCSQLISGLKTISGIKILGPVEKLSQSGHLVSFVSDKMHPHDIAAYLDTKNIAVRAGNHCAQPLFDILGISSSIRASFYMYNTSSEVDTLVTELRKLLG